MNCVLQITFNCIFWHILISRTFVYAQTKEIPWWNENCISY
uniref:Uncharacterized protein n=1 Tax=Arundo donax TaxID=35708 RepID=A0A0A9CJI0_ARUDO